MMHKRFFSTAPGRARLVSLAAMIVSLVFVAPPPARAQAKTAEPGRGVSVLTFHNDNGRLGWNARETTLTHEAVASPAFGRLWAAPLDGAVPGSPLVLAGRNVAGQTRDVVFAATDHNSVFALDAGDGRVLWERRELAKPLTDAQFSGDWDRDDRRGYHGILSTPVIDAATGTLYVCVLRARALKQLYEVWALDVHTSKTRPGGWPVTLAGSYKNSPFVAGQVMQRGALSIVNGWVYVPFGGRGDRPPWRGWVMGVNAARPSAPQRAFCTSPVTDGGGVWSGGGVSADAAGHLYAVTGNGDYDLFKGGDNLGQTVVRLQNEDKTGLRFSRQAADYYTPANYKFLDEQDEDLGGATALVLPPLPQSSTPNLLFTGGKDGLAYLLNRDRLGGVGGEVQKMRLFSEPNATYHEGIRATSCYFDAGGANGRFVYVAGDEPGPDKRLGLVALKLAPSAPGGPARFSPAWTLPQKVAGPGSPVVSSDKAANAIVWLVETGDNDQNSVLHAYDALTGRALYGPNAAGSTPDRFSGGRRFTSPAVANGRVFVNANGIVCYGLKPAATATGGAK